MSKIKIQPTTFEFLKQLKKNNNRDWFNAKKEKYLAELKHIELFADALLHDLNKTDVIETASGKKSLHRIYRDVRFSKDKIPYNTHFGGSFSREGKTRRGGYYFHIEPGNTFIAGGFWGPSPEDLKRVRDELSFDAKPLRKILRSKQFVNTFGELIGDQIKTTPKGFDAESEAIDLLRYKQYLVKRNFTDKEPLSDNFLKQASETFKNMRPFFDYMSEVLSTDVNGIEKV